MFALDAYRKLVKILVDSVELIFKQLPLALNGAYFAMSAVIAFIRFVEYVFHVHS